MKSITMKQSKFFLNKWQTMLMSSASWMRYVIVAALLAFLVMGATSCSKQKLQPNETSEDGLGITTIGTGEPAKEFDVKRFINRVNSSLTTGPSTARGYALVVTRNGQILDTASSGWGLRLNDGSIA